MDDDSYDGLKKLIEDTIKEIFETDVKPVLMKIYQDDREMLKESDKRISRTNEIIDKLADACKSVENAYTSHVGSLQSSRDASQKANTELIKTCERLSKRLERTDDTNRKRIMELNGWIAALLDERKETKAQYEELQKSYLRIAEAGSVKQSGNTMEMNVNSK
nr:MAG TPA: hypothetical protein [Caudoviricetes sp.]